LHPANYEPSQTHLVADAHAKKANGKPLGDVAGAKTPSRKTGATKRSKLIIVPRRKNNVIGAFVSDRTDRKALGTLALKACPFSSYFLRR
jgi:hypothetical protein